MPQARIPFDDQMPPIPEGVLERWLREEVLPVVLAMEADPNRGIPAKQVRAELEKRHARRMKRARRRVPKGGHPRHGE